mmetsp:Transcript_77568/g.197130  ORF Transcript_77568/g.197130 Transcript_77568/m.197130 type:complete len:109 (-) Transcript_77568:16-342(-)
MTIPPVDRNIETNSPDGLRVAGYCLGRPLGGGVSARVFEAEPPPGMAPAVPNGEVFRVMPKSSVRLQARNRSERPLSERQLRLLATQAFVQRPTGTERIRAAPPCFIS